MLSGNMLSMIICALQLTATSEAMQLPYWFKLGAGSSATQIEGGWNATDKGESIWDRYIPAHLDKIKSIEVSCNSYNLWRRDVEMCEELGLGSYRFSILWSRLLPTGLPDIISEDGTRYYNNLIDALIERNITPVVTMYHMDLPQRLQDLGGWTNPLMIEWFAAYSRIIFTLFGDRVKYWLTINEPLIVCDLGYTKNLLPYIDDPHYGVNLCNKHMLLAHATAYRIYEKEFKPQYNGKVSIVTLFFWLKPMTPDDIEVTDIAREYVAGRFDHPIYSKDGGWPKKLEAFFAQKENCSYCALPPLTDDEIELVKGTSDYYAFNHYISRLVRKAKPGEKCKVGPPYGSNDIGAVFESDPNWKLADADWFSMYPEGLREQLNWLQKKYDIKEFFIAENGFLSTNASLADTRPIKYTQNYLEQALLAIEDGVNVTGYMTWSLMDSWEHHAYNFKFGLYHVDFDDDNRTRTIRDYGRYYSKVARTRSTDPVNYL